MGTGTFPNRLRAMVVVLAGCSIAACSGDRRRSHRNDVATIAGALVTNSALPSSFKIAPTVYFESTAKVAPPSVNFPNGRIAVQTGGPVRLLTRDLYGANGKINTSELSGATSDRPYPPLSNANPAIDNQMVRLMNGAFLAMKNTTFWPNPPLLPYSDLSILPPALPGARGGHSFVTLTHLDTMDSDWSVASLIDFGTFAGGKWGYPRPGDNGTWFGGGSDRQELYACPFTQNLYLTGHLTSGPYVRGGFNEPTRDVRSLFMSQDGGTSWTVVREDLPMYVPTLMTSTPNGRLFLFGIPPNDDHPVVQFSEPMGFHGTPTTWGAAVDVSFFANGQRVPYAQSAFNAGFMIVSDANPGLGLNAAGGARDQGPLQITSACTASNPDCVWSYRSGMIVSARDPTLAINALNGPGTTNSLVLNRLCASNNLDCTWTYKQGRFLNDHDPTIVISTTSGTVTDNAPLGMRSTTTCPVGGQACSFTLKGVLLSNGASAAAQVNAYGGAAEGRQLKLSTACTVANPDCTWTFKRGVIYSDTNAGLAVKPSGMTANGSVVALTSTCSQSDPSCTWTWTKGQLVSDNSGSSPLAIKAAGTADGSALFLNDACSPTNPACVSDALLRMAADEPSIGTGTSISRISSDTSSSKVRLVYPSVNAFNMQEIRLVNLNATDPVNPVVTSVATITATDRTTQSVVYPTFIEPDYVDMPNFIRSNTAVLYWEEVPARAASNHAYSARYATISGDSDVGTTGILSVTDGVLRTWTVGQSWGDYVNGGFFWSGKTLNYLPQWVEPTGIHANVVTVNSAPGFLIKSGVSSSLAVNAFGGAMEGTVVKLHNQCAIDNPHCTWSYQRGMLVSDADPTLAITAGPSPVAGTQLTLTRNCSRDDPSCTWTYTQGRFVSDSNPLLAVRATGAQLGTALTLSTLLSCGTSQECRWTLPHVVIMIDRDSKLALNAFNGAVNGNSVSLHHGCSLDNADCTWSMAAGVISSDGNPMLSVRAVGGAVDGSLVKLSNDCSQLLSCRWTWSKGELISDNSGSTPLPINAFGGASVGATLKINSACTASNPDCLFSGLFGK